MEAGQAGRQEVSRRSAASILRPRDALDVVGSLRRPGCVNWLLGLWAERAGHSRGAFRKRPSTPAQTLLFGRAKTPPPCSSAQQRPSAARARGNAPRAPPPAPARTRRLPPTARLALANAGQTPTQMRAQARAQPCRPTHRLSSGHRQQRPRRSCTGWQRPTPRPSAMPPASLQQCSWLRPSACGCNRRCSRRSSRYSCRCCSRSRSRSSLHWRLLSQTASRRRPCACRRRLLRPMMPRPRHRRHLTARSGKPMLTIRSSGEPACVQLQQKSGQVQVQQPPVAPPPPPLARAHCHPSCLASPLPAAPPSTGAAATAAAVRDGRRRGLTPLESPWPARALTHLARAPLAPAPARASPCLEPHPSGPCAQCAAPLDLVTPPRTRPSAVPHA